MTIFNKKIVLVEAPSNFGLKQIVEEGEPGVRFLSDALIQAGLLKNLDVAEMHKIVPKPYAAQMDLKSRILNAPAVREYAIELSAKPHPIINKSNFVLTLGGDCSILIGITHALKKSGRYALFFIDGHTDFLYPEYSSTKQAAAMELALLTGNGYEGLSNIDNSKPYILEDDVWCVGNRKWDEKTTELINESTIKYIDLIQFRSMKPNEIVTQFLLSINQKQLNGFWLHLDVDVLHDSIMPCVDHRQPDGLWYEELGGMVRELLKSDFLVGMDVTIFNPLLDKDNKFATESSQR